MSQIIVDVSVGSSFYFLNTSVEQSLLAAILPQFDLKTSTMGVKSVWAHYTVSPRIPSSSTKWRQIEIKASPSDCFQGEFSLSRLCRRPVLFWSWESCDRSLAECQAAFSSAPLCQVRGCNEAGSRGGFSADRMKVARLTKRQVWFNDRLKEQFHMFRCLICRSRMNLSQICMKSGSKRKLVTLYLRIELKTHGLV